MKERILDAISQAQQDGKSVTEIHLWSKEAVEEIHKSPEFQNGAFVGITVKYLGRDHHTPEHDFLLITKD
jgi:hypothetical protein